MYTYAHIHVSAIHTVYILLHGELDQAIYEAANS